MSLSPPSLDLHDANNPGSGVFPTISSIAFTGTGYGGAIVVGKSSAVFVARVYNNFTGSGPLADAINCVLASYDDTTHQGSSTTPAVTQAWLNVQVTKYTGVAVSDTLHPIGGAQAYAITANSGTLQGNAGGGTTPFTSYIELALSIVVPASATAASGAQGLWLEYSWIT